MFRNLLLAVGLAATAVAPAGALTTPGTPALPVTPFVQNDGQLPGPARYYAVSGGASVYFEPHSVLLDRAPRSSDGRGVRLRVDFPNSSGRAALTAAQPLSGQMSVFGGADARQWRSGIRSFGEVRYEGVAPGADLVYRLHDGRLKYDAVLSPGSDLSQLVLRYSGAQGLAVGTDGVLEIRTAVGVLTEEAPFLYQEIGGLRVPVTGGYRILGDDGIGFWAEGTDPALPLVVDPGLLWSTFLGGNGADCGYAVTTDTNGDIYIAGSSTSTNYPTGTGAYQRNLLGGSDVVVTKLRADGQSVIWSTYLGGIANDVARGIAVDHSGNVYVCGYTYSTDFPTTSGSFQPAAGGGGSDAFVTKLNASGSALVYSTYLGGSGQESAYGIVVDGSNVATVAGMTGSGNYPTTTGVLKRYHTVTFNDVSDGFLTRINAAGSGLVWSTYFGSEGGTDYLSGVALDGNGQPVVAGSTSSAYYPTTAGAYSRTFKGILDGFVAKVTANGSALVWSTYVGGSDEEYIYALGMDATYAVYVAGITKSTDFPTVNAFQSTNRGAGDAFVTKLKSDGTGLVYSTYLGGAAYDDARALVVTSSGQACVVGTSGSTGYPTTSGAVRTSLAGGWDVVATALNASGSGLVYSTYLGASGSDLGYGVAQRPNGSIVTAGSTDNTAFPTTAGAYDVTQNSAGTADGFATTLDMGLSSGGNTGVADLIAGGVALSAGPNPFRSYTSINFALATETQVSLRVHDVQGRLVRVLVNGPLSAGGHSYTWDGRDASGRPVGSGVYLVEMSTPSMRGTVRVVRVN